MPEKLHTGGLNEEGQAVKITRSDVQRIFPKKVLQELRRTNHIIKGSSVTVIMDGEDYKEKLLPVQTWLLANKGIAIHQLSAKAIDDNKVAVEMARYLSSFRGQSAENVFGRSGF